MFIIRQLIAALVFAFLGQGVSAQTCTAPGQTPSTAFPVCGTSVFQQTTVPLCVSHDIAVPGCSGAQYQDKNPYWYKFTCFETGTLGFLIAPANPSDDYDWQLYDITNESPDAVFSNPALVVTGNWAGTAGSTGAAASGVSFIQCASDPAANKNSFSKMPQLIKGHTYLLLVSHYTDSQSGYNLSFGGGTAVITDPTTPALQTAVSNCSGDVIKIKLNKKIRCSSLAGNGSDFTINAAAANIIGVKGIGCGAGFDTDSVEIMLSAPLPPGNYFVQMQNGTDGNTLLDYCNNAIADGTQVSFTVQPSLPTPMDSLEKLQCRPQVLKLVFAQPLRCSSIAANGSDFAITGTYPVSITAAVTKCDASGLTKEIILQLSEPLYRQGNFFLALKTGTDGSTIVNECNKPTPAGATINFAVKDTVSAEFSYQKKYGCVIDTVQFFHNGQNGVTSWQWQLDENLTSSLQNAEAHYKAFNAKNISLVVSNGFCTDSSSQLLQLENYMEAAFEAYDDNCPNEPVTFKSTATGSNLSHHWSFGDGSTATTVSPVYQYKQPFSTTPYPVTYTITNSMGCQSVAKKIITIYSSCYLAVPNAFTPNGDGKNDQLKILNAIKAENLEFKIFNRWGQLVFTTRNWKQGWDGTVKGVPQGAGTYVWFLTYTERNAIQPRTLKGTAVLIR